MKIVQINAVYGYGSTGKNVEELHKWLLLNGHQSFVFSTSKPKDENVFKIGSTLDQKCHALLARMTGKEGHFSVLQTKKIIRSLETIKPDVVHLHNLHANFINLPLLASYLAKRRIPTCVTLHDCWPFTGKCTHYTAAKCEKWKHGCGGCPLLHDDIPAYRDKTSVLIEEKQKLFNNIPNFGLIGVSNWIRDEAKQSVLGNARLIETIYNWVDTDIFKPRQKDMFASEHAIGKKIALGVASYWNKRKKIQVFNSFSMASNEFLVALVGRVPRGFQGSSNLLLLGEVPNQLQLSEYYSSADVFLQLSKEETFGKTVAESLACGTPVITNDSTANPELVSANTGVICDTDDLSELLNAAREITKENGVIKSENCRRWVLENCQPESQFKKHLEFYKKLVELP